MNDAIFCLVGLVVGAVIVLAVVTLRRRHEAALAQRLIDETQKQKVEELADLT